MWNTVGCEIPSRKDEFYRPHHRRYMLTFIQPLNSIKLFANSLLTYRIKTSHKRPVTSCYISNFIGNRNCKPEEQQEQRELKPLRRLDWGAWNSVTRCKQSNPKGCQLFFVLCLVPSTMIISWNSVHKFFRDCANRHKFPLKIMFPMGWHTERYTGRDRRVDRQWWHWTCDSVQWGSYPCGIDVYSMLIKAFFPSGNPISIFLAIVQLSVCCTGPLFLTWFNLNPKMDK